MNKMIRMLPYLLVCLLAFYIGPLVGRNTLSPMFLLLMAIPAVCFLVSLIYGIINGFQPLQLLFPVFVGVLFVPTIYIFYNDTAWIYAIVYAVISFLGNGAGYAISTLLRRPKPEYDVR